MASAAHPVCHEGAENQRKWAQPLSAPLRGMAEESGEDDASASLIAFDMEEEEETSFLTEVSSYTLASRAAKIAVMKKRGEIYVLDASAEADDDLSESRVDLSNVVIELEPREEWAQIFHEGWRHMRDFYWDAGLAGLDWNAVREQYASLLPRLATRDDLRDLMGEVIGELATSHTYVWGGDAGVSVASVAVGLLGADLSRDGRAYRIDRIYRGDAADLERSPLRAPGVGVKEGDYILAVNHEEPPADAPFHAAMVGLADKDVVLTVASSADGKGKRDVVVRTLASESGVRYADWVRCNREAVAARTEGKIGYIHVPDMGSDGLIEFDTWFYPQLDREGMVVDMRWNGGGFVSQLILERFRRRILSFDRARGGGIYTYPYRTLNGPFVVLTNQFAGSDGDIFPRAVQLEKLAPVIGMRSWGGVIGIRNDKALVDGGSLTQPEFAWWEPEAGWSLENRGVEPDIELENLPQELARGVDAQLERGIAEVLRLHRENPPVKPAFGIVEPKTRDAFRDE